MRYLAGIDIGGTKCAVTLGKEDAGSIQIWEKRRFPTPDDPQEAVNALVDTLRRLLEDHPEVQLSAAGVSCGSPLDSKRGLILCPPNLPNWDHIDVVTPFSEAFGVPAAVQNDANACALAEWLWGAGRGCENMIFLTFGTGLGAGLILNGQLYAGSCDMAGEAGHIRLEPDGPVGYGKAGSFEGFCSGGGIARYGQAQILKHLQRGGQTAVLAGGKKPEEVTTADIGKAAQAGDILALQIMEHTGRMLGKGISVLLDLFNPQRIVIGSIFLRQEALLRPPMEEEIRREALSYTRESCRILPAGLGESLGDYAALSVAGNIGRK
ncbi:MAG: ROK family protein [Eubacteriales bacterium]|nr:ROK family protein [Eubacteriales bacterium]